MKDARPFYMFLSLDLLRHRDDGFQIDVVERVQTSFGFLGPLLKLVQIPLQRRVADEVFELVLLPFDGREPLERVLTLNWDQKEQAVEIVKMYIDRKTSLQLYEETMYHTDQSDEALDSESSQHAGVVDFSASVNDMIELAYRYLLETGWVSEELDNRYLQRALTLSEEDRDAKKQILTQLFEKFSESNGKFVQADFIRAVQYVFNNYEDGGQPNTWPVKELVSGNARDNDELKEQSRPRTSDRKLESVVHELVTNTQLVLFDLENADWDDITDAAFVVGWLRYNFISFSASTILQIWIAFTDGTLPIPLELVDHIDTELDE
jgi:hypothetical protein